LFTHSHAFPSLIVAHKIKMNKLTFFAFLILSIVFVGKSTFLSLFRIICIKLAVKINLFFFVLHLKANRSIVKMKPQKIQEPQEIQESQKIPEP
jgi:hypothetical protein